MRSSHNSSWLWIKPIGKSQNSYLMQRFTENTPKIDLSPSSNHSWPPTLSQGNPILDDNGNPKRRPPKPKPVPPTPLSSSFLPLQGRTSLKWHHPRRPIRSRNAIPSQIWPMSLRGDADLNVLKPWTILWPFFVSSNQITYGRDKAASFLRCKIRERVRGPTLTITLNPKS